MTKFSTSLTINSSQEVIWKVLSDVTRWHEWTPTVQKVEVLDSPELKLNNHYKVFQPKLQPAVWTVTVFESPSIFTWETSAPGMRMVAEHILSAKGANQTELTLTFSFLGFLGSIIGKLMSKTVESYVTTEAQSLKKRVETS
ncbi:MAG: SRPBCC family protein [Chloroflexi bacterium]|nr:SRPBCC family protein [Chloroflexota bacterium]